MCVYAVCTGPGRKLKCESEKRDLCTSSYISAPGRWAGGISGKRAKLNKNRMTMRARPCTPTRASAAFPGAACAAPRGPLSGIPPQPLRHTVALRVCLEVSKKLAYCLEGENPSRPGGAEPLVFGDGTTPCAPCCPGSPAAPALCARGSSMLSLRSPVGTCTWLGSGVRVRG